MIYIKKGRQLITGQDVDSGWTLRVPGFKSEVFRELKQAKDKAIQCGASGHWRREVKPVGVIGKDVVFYYDAKGGE